MKPLRRMLLVCAALLVCEWLAAAEPSKAARFDRLGDPLPDGALLRLGSRRLCHPFGPFGVAGVLFTHDGKTLITSGNSIREWDVETGKLVRTLSTHVWGTHLALAPDGHMLAALFGANEVCIFDLRTGLQLDKIERPGGQAPGNWLALALTPDGRTLATSGGASLIQFWDIRTTKLLRQFGDADGTRAIAIAPDGKSIATVAGEDLVMRDANSGKELWRCAEGRQGLWCVAFAPDGKTVAAGGSSGTVRLWAVAGSGFSRRLTGHRGEVRAVAFSPDGKLLASGGKDCTVRLWEVASGKELRTLRGHTGIVWSVAFSPDGKKLASGSEDCTVRLWDVATGADKVPLPGHREDVWDFALSPDGKTLVTIGRDETLRQWDLASGREVRMLTTAGIRPGRLTHLPDGRLRAWQTRDGSLLTYDPRAGKLRSAFPANGADSRVLAYLPDGSVLAVSGENDLCLLRGVECKEAWRLRRTENAPYPSHVAFSPDGKTIALDIPLAAEPKRRGTTYLYDAGTQREIRRLARGVTPDDVTALAYSPDGSTLAVGYAYGGRQLSLWDAATGREKWRLGEVVAGISHLAFSPNARFLASTGREDVIRLWEVATGKLVCRFDPGEDDSGKLVYTPDGRRLLSQGYSTVLVWDATGLTGATPPKRLAAQEVQSLWDALSGDDARQAYNALWRLSAAAEQSVPFIGERLRPVPAISEKDVARWLAALDDDDFAVRQRATEELGRLGDAVAPALRRALGAKPSAEAQRRLENLVKAAEALLVSGERLRELRAVAALEYAATADAARHLETLARGAPEARLTRDARAALECLTKRTEQRSK